MLHLLCGGNELIIAAQWIPLLFAHETGRLHESSISRMFK